jgi:hypothetical protein
MMYLADQIGRDMLRLESFGPLSKKTEYFAFRQNWKRAEVACKQLQTDLLASS